LRTGYTTTGRTSYVVTRFQHLRKRHKNPAPAHERAQLAQPVGTFRRDIRQLQLEHDVLKKADEQIKKKSASTRNS
jgi:hypothetical protein